MTTKPSDPMRRIFERVTRELVAATAVIGVLAFVAGYLVDSWRGVLGAGIGVVIAVVFSGTTVVSMRYALRRPPAVLAGIVLGSWLAKMVVLIALLALLQDETFYNKVVFAVVLVTTVLVSVVIDVRAVVEARIPHGETGGGFTSEPPQ